MLLLLCHHSHRGFQPGNDSRGLQHPAATPADASSSTHHTLLLLRPRGWSFGWVR
jgi:hypothetical protein